MIAPTALSPEQGSRLHDVSTAQLSQPPFLAQNPEVWYHHIDMRFSLYRTVLETTCYDHVASVLPRMLPARSRTSFPTPQALHHSNT